MVVVPPMIFASAVCPVLPALYDDWPGRARPCRPRRPRWRGRCGWAADGELVAGVTAGRGSGVAASAEVVSSVAARAAATPAPQKGRAMRIRRLCKEVPPGMPMSR
ncbi:hypothetical protein SGLAM104S_08497 [Streptomyces glaucescens]